MRTIYTLVLAGLLGCGVAAAGEKSLEEILDAISEKHARNQERIYEEYHAQIRDEEAKRQTDALERIARLQSEQLEQQKEAAKQADYRARQQIEATKNIAGYEKGCPYWIVNGERVYGLNYRFSSKKD